MDKRKSILNVGVSVTFKVITMILAIVMKRFLIQACGNEVNGLNALYLSIIGFLSVAELGVGTAISFCMYKPIVEGDHDKVSALYHLFRRLYIIIGSIILVSGLAITPFIRYFARDYAQIDVDLYLTFILMLISVVITYFYAAKTSLINAYKNDYITTAINSCGILLQYGLQILVLLTTKSFAWYLVCRILASLAQWIATDAVARKKHKQILCEKKKVDESTKQELSKSIKAMFMHKVGGLLVNTADSVIISVFLGVVTLGNYSNYTTILSSMVGIISLVFTSLTSVFGHLYAEASRETTRKYCEAFHLLNFVIATVFFLGYYSIIDNLIGILYFRDLVMVRDVAFVITLNGFVQYMRKCTLTFRDATGTFYNDRWKPLAEGVSNVVLSVLFVKWFGVTGVIGATIFTNLLICHVVEPYVLYKHAFGVSPKGYYLRNYGMILVFGLSLLLLDRCMQSYESQWAELLVNGCISVGISFAACGFEMLLDRKNCKHILRLVKKR